MDNKRAYLALLLSVCVVIVCGQEVKSGRYQRSGPECTLPVSIGTCNSNVTRYYYDLNTRSCQKFIFSGCGGNLNNYPTKKDCNMRCVCSRPMKPGNGMETLARYYYNVASGQCEQYSFSGRGGNANRFRTVDACSATCIEDYSTSSKRCFRRPEFGRDCGNSTIRYYYDQNCDCCREFTYLGCGGNGNRFESEAVCVNRCVGDKNRPSTTSSPTVNPTTRPSMCLEPPTRGPCTQTVSRYHFDTGSGACKPFSYSGCGGNGNNFMVESDCRTVCKASSSMPTTTLRPPPAQCTQEIKRGSCGRIILRFYYNQSSRSCRMFLYSGCGGNSNNFRSYMECVATCRSNAIDVANVV